jgi:hypothetical protein
MSRFVEHTGSAIFAVPHDARRAGFIARNCCETRGSVTGQWRLESRDAERAVLALVTFGIVCAATRRPTLFQVLGIVLFENGFALAALELPGTSPSLAIELGGRQHAHRARRRRLPREPTPTSRVARLERTISPRGHRSSSHAASSSRGPI